MQTIESLTIKVTYEVGLGKVDMPKEVYEQLQEAYDNGDSIDHNEEKYTLAYEWIIDNIRQRDNYEYKADVEEITE